MLKPFGVALLLASGLAITAGPALALQTVATQVDKNADGSMTYHFAVKTDQGETLTPGESKATADFVTIYNFYGLVDGSAKSPAGWEFSSEEFGRIGDRYLSRSHLTALYRNLFDHVQRHPSCRRSWSFVVRGEE